VAVVRLDIGGANLKAVHSTGQAILQPFALWKLAAELPAALAQLLACLPGSDLLAVTMTGELCDCFETKRQGVLAILDAVTVVAGSTPVLVWQNDGRFVSLAEAYQSPLPAAAANWLALATYAGRHAPAGAALLIDIGSTTTDIIPLLNGKPAPVGRTDPERMRHRELVYTGVRRTPVCALLGDAVAAEFFASTLDAYLLLGRCPEDPSDRETADGRPATRSNALARLARMLCADAETCPMVDGQRLAETVWRRQVRLVRDAVDHVAAHLPDLVSQVILSGSGEFLIHDVLNDAPALEAKRVSLAELIGPRSSTCACAFALAQLAMAASERTAAPTVVKVGGSLFDLPDLGSQLARWLQTLSAGPIFLVPGGGRLADTLRELDQRHRLGEVRAHWLALQALTLNAHFLAGVLPRAAVVQDLDACAACWSSGTIPILDAHTFAQADEGQPGALPASWNVTSDSLAARVAHRAGARQLILLKSISLEPMVDLAEAARCGVVDPYFACTAAGLSVKVVNFRAWPS
jgi:probable H4MPT-linked C1 transfer pathway protein